MAALDFALRSGRLPAMGLHIPDPLTLGPRVDGALARLARTREAAELNGWPVRFLDVTRARVRVLDTGSDKPCVVFVPDGPNVIEHYLDLITRLSPDARVVCFDMPGFGFSRAGSDYDHSLDHGAATVRDVLDALGIEQAALAFSCANGLYALRAARLWPTRVRSLFLSQTPSLQAMQAWTDRVIPGPLRVPVVGQLTSRLARKTLAARWYEMALPSRELVAPFRTTARAALQDGAFFSLAGVVQGLLGCTQSDIEQVTPPCSMLWGSADRTHRKTDPQSLRACSGHAHISCFEGVGHFPDLERPEKFAELLLAHLEALVDD